MDDKIRESVKQQFGTNASRYTTSPVHARGRDLTLLLELAGLTGQERVLDVATGTGHTALTVAPHAREVIGIDLTPEMLTEARRLTVEKQLGNVSYREGDAEALPFPDADFDLVTCRQAAHHFASVETFCQEAVRVLRPGGRLLVVDNVAPEDDVADAYINQIEKVRDPSHVRAYRLSEWEHFLNQVGLIYTEAHAFPIVQDQEQWLKVQQVSENVAREVRRRLQEAPSQIKATFRITSTHFCLRRAVVLSRKP